MFTQLASTGVNLSKGKESKGKEGQGKERKEKERKGKEGEGRERKGEKGETNSQAAKQAIRKPKKQTSIK